MSGFTACVLYRHDRERLRLAGPDDVARLLRELAEGGWENSAANVYLGERPLNRGGVPDHELQVAVCQGGSYGALRYQGADYPVTAFTQGTASRPDGHQYCNLGYPCDFPAGAELPLSTVFEAVVEFLVSGGRPMSVPWADDPLALEIFAEYRRGAAV